MHGGHGGFRSGPEFKEPRSPEYESALKKVGLFLAGKLGEAGSLLFMGRRPSKEDRSPETQAQSTAFGGSAPRDFEEVARPREPGNGKVEMAGGSLPVGQTVHIQGVQSPQNPNLN